MIWIQIKDFHCLLGLVYLPFAFFVKNLRTPWPLGKAHFAYITMSTNQDQYKEVQGQVQATCVSKKRYLGSLIFQGIMGKPNAFMSILRDYADVATVHGINYIFSRSLPSIDRFLWAFFTAAWWEFFIFDVDHFAHCPVSPLPCTCPSSQRSIGVKIQQ